MSDWLDAETQVERAHEFYERGRWDDAERALRCALAVNPYQAEWHFNLGLTLEAAGRHGEAAEAFSDAANLQPSEFAGAISAAANLIRADRAAAALGWLERAEAAGAPVIDVCLHRIEAYTELGRHDDAELAFYLAQQSGPEDPDLYATMGESLLDRNEVDRALWCLREAARLDPDLDGIYARLARAYEQSGRYERARQLYVRELRRQPGDIDTLLDLVRLLRVMHRDAEAGEKLRRVLEIEPRCAEAHAVLSEIAEDYGDGERAIAELDLALRLDPTMDSGRARLAGLLLRRGRTGDAERVAGLLDAELVAVHAEDAADTDRLTALTELLLDAGRPSDAVVIAGRLVAARSGDPAAVHLLSVAMLEAGDLVGGMQRARAVVRMSPRFVPAMHNLALSHIRRGEWLRAKFWVSQASQIDPEDGTIRRLKARLLCRAALSFAWAVVGVVAGMVTVTFRRPRRRQHPARAGRPA